MAAKQYGYVHRAERNHWDAFVQAGEVSCARCGRLIPPGTIWHLGHDHRGNGPSLPEHRRCNQNERNKRCNWKLRKPRRPKRSRAW